ncbi:MAG: ATP-binding cassette domain-containing protein [Clostridia bacterium]|nr:ATP-binding cassette domain-containing protein [Clostridia bacterium]
MIELKNITKSYYVAKNEIKVLKGIDLKLREKEFVSILGPSGCGKTTLLNIIGGLDRYTEGDITIDGISTKEYKSGDWDNYRNKKIGFVFQAYNLIPHQNVLKNVEMPLILAGFPKAECEVRALNALDRVGLKDQAKKKPSQMSGGQMQRVAIARALVTNPEIILADEPTGALDSESSEQVMEILREIAKEHLVLMVTHNNELAEEYSTRIINVKDGLIIGDSDPIKEDEGWMELPEEITANPTKAYLTIKKQKKRERKIRKKSHLSVWTSIKLSFANLVSKRNRTSLTAFAGAIGIIGISLVLAFSTGVKNYINLMEEKALSLYPLMVEQANMDLTSLANAFLNTDIVSTDEYPESDEITTKNLFGEVLNAIFKGFLTSNDMSTFKEYVDENFDSSLGYVKYVSGLSINAYADNEVNEGYRKVEPVIESIQSFFEENEQFSQISDVIDIFSSVGTLFSSWEQLLPSQEVLQNQYELIGKNSKFPKNEIYYDENGQAYADVIIMVNAKNELPDYAQTLLGLKGLPTMSTLNEYEGNKYTVDDLLKLKFRVVAGSSYYYSEIDDKGNKQWNRYDSMENSAEFVENHTDVIVRVSGVVRPKKNGTGTAMGGVIGYDASLLQKLVETAESSEAVEAQKNSNYLITAHYDVDEHGIKSYPADAAIRSTKDRNEILSQMGVADLTNPKSIYFYAKSFDAKNKIVEFIDEYNNQQTDKAKKIKYTDSLGTLMQTVDTITSIITYALVGFTAVSLVVSSIMIAVLIYTSVIERRKEVGILRSVGARKQDISNIFMAESGIIGLYSGIMGVVISWVITIPINLILQSVAGILNIASVVWWHGLVMIGISTVLSLVAGLIPAGMAAKLDPAVALRNE